MMTLLQPPPSVLSDPQRRCHLLLTLCLPGQTVTPQVIARLNGVDEAVVHQDIADARHEIRENYRLNILTQPDGSYRIEGTALDRRLCLLHWLRRGLRLCPDFVRHQFAPALKQELRQQGISRALYDDTNLQALVNLCSRRLQRQFTPGDNQFLNLYLQFCLTQHQQGHIPQFSDSQRRWAQTRAEALAAKEIVRHWDRRTPHPPHENERLFLAVLFMLLRTPDPRNDSQRQDRRLKRAIADLIAHFRELSGRDFSDEKGLSRQLYIHLAQALDRSLFDIMVASPVTRDVATLYPKLMRTTREALIPFENRYGVRFSDDEAGLVAVIFGAWLMQAQDLHERQVLIVTSTNPSLEAEIEQQLRELTLLPIAIRHQSLTDFQASGSPKGVAVIVTPYATPLPLVSPPLIHSEGPLGERQQRHIREILEG
jgi:transcriptional antiterminator